MHKTIPSISLILFLFNIIISNNFHYVEPYKKDTLTKKIEIHDIKAGTLVKKIEGTNKYEILPRVETHFNSAKAGSSSIMKAKFN